MTTTDRLDVVQRLLTDRPAFHQGGEVRWDALPGTLEAIRRFTHPGDSTIETGAGASTVVFAASGASHTAISPDPAEHERVRDYCQRIGVDVSRITFVIGFSDDALPSLLGRDRTLDVAFIDGEHSYPLPVVDWYYATRSLKIGGKLLIDDIPIPAAGQLFRHMRLEPNWHLEGVLDDRSAAFTLLAPPETGDWLSQPFNKGYPDLSFADLPKRLHLETEYRLRNMRHSVAQRFPKLHNIYKRAI
jgi:Methyltransferase domain